MTKELVDLKSAYTAAGLVKGDTVFIHANLLSFGLVSHGKKGFVEYFLSPLLDIIGDTGTIAVLTYTFSYAPGKIPFVYETSPSEAGMFTEHIRNMAGAIRSFHPLCSVVAFGPQAAAIADF
jgi:aminoglycoside N3'-acetyltransferase